MAEVEENIFSQDLDHNRNALQTIERIERSLLEEFNCRSISSITSNEFLLSIDIIDDETGSEFLINYPLNNTRRRKNVEGFEVWKTDDDQKTIPYEGLLDYEERVYRILTRIAVIIKESNLPVIEHKSGPNSLFITIARQHKIELIFVSDEH